MSPAAYRHSVPFLTPPRTAHSAATPPGRVVQSSRTHPLTKGLPRARGRPLPSLQPRRSCLVASSGTELASTVQFGKRLSAEAEARGGHWREHYIDYKACKRAIQADVEARDPLGRTFEHVIGQELQKVSAFYLDQEEQLQAAMELLSAAPPEAVASFASRVLHLRKYVVLNYVCVVKAAKKRNRHLKVVCGEQGVASLRAVDILSKQHFFTSPKLASMATQAEILSKELQPVTASLLQEYQCPICLGLLRGAVVLTCAHRFCWGCIVTHCTSVMGRLSHAGSEAPAPGDGGKEAKAAQGSGSSGSVAAAAAAPLSAASWEGEHSDDEQTLATFDCPVCRKAQLLDLDRLQVDPHLDAFVRKLERQGQQAVVAERERSEGAEQKALDTPQACSQATPSQPPTAQATPTSTVEPLLSVEAMDAVLEYLHKEHRALEEEKRHRRQQELRRQEQQQQRAASQPRAIDAASSGSALEAMDVDPKPSARSGLLAASEDEEGVATSPFHAAAAQAAAALPAPPQRLALPPPRPAPARAAAPAKAPAVAAGPEIVLVQHSAPASSEPPLLPPLRPEDDGKLTVCLDLDGTLVSTFTPKRAPVLPATAVSYVVGRGGKLNPGGVFVVERPGLGEFFRRIARVAEVVLFTAGLEDYAAPICDMLQSKYGGCFVHRLYRPACVPDEVYPCVKDMSRLGRDMKRTLLVDDTPLAFFRQPDNGIPVLQFRGDVDDQLLSEAVAPLIESLAAVPDVRAELARRFNMTKWFQAQGLQLARPPAAVHRAPSMPALHRPASAPAPRPVAAPQAARDLPSSTEILHQQRQHGVLLVCDFDRTLIDYDAGERLCDELAPELTSLLSSLEMPANFVPVTNTVLAEMQRRGVSRDRILGTLRTMGQEVPLATVRMLQWASRTGLDVRVLSDCNSVVINTVLAGAKVNSCVREVVTNLSAFQRVVEAEAPQEEAGQQQAAAAGGWLQRAFGGGSGSGGGLAGRPKPAMQRLVITPRHPYQEHSHDCPLCPENMCKGQELEAMWGGGGRRAARTIYCGDGANDLCPSLRLGPQDVVLARKGYALHQLIEKRAGAPDGVRRVRAQVLTWSTHEELWQLVQDAACI